VLPVKEVKTLVNPSYPRPKKRKAKGSRKTGSHKHRSNPAPLVLTLGAVNPQERKTMAKSKKKKKKTSHPSSKARAAKAANRNGKKKKNPSKRTNVVSLSSLKAMMGKKKKNGGKRGRSRNPLAIFGTSGSVKIVGIMAGVAGGVTAAKLLPPMMPATWTATAGMRFLTTAGVVVGISVAAHFALPAPYRDAVIVGAGSQLLSVALNPIVAKVTPNITLEGLRRRGVGDFVPANFPEPNNPIWRPAIAAPGATTSGGKLGRYQGRYN